jgi:hypothetical protein
MPDRTPVGETDVRRIRKVKESATPIATCKGVVPLSPKSFARVVRPRLCGELRRIKFAAIVARLSAAQS